MFKNMDRGADGGYINDCVQAGGLCDTEIGVYGVNSCGKTDGVIDTFRDLTPEDAVCFRLERAECIPRYKIRWYSEYGEYAEHEFSDNLRNGINTVDGIEYHINFVSVLRRALDLR